MVVFIEGVDWRDGKEDKREVWRNKMGGDMV
jgi:hypothetical protein